ISILNVAFIFGVFMLIVFAPVLLMLWFWNADRRLSMEHWAILLLLLLVGGLLTRIALLSVLAAVVLLAIGAAWAWHRLILADLRYEHVFQDSHIFPGEETTITWSITNDKPIPISWLRWQEAVPLRLYGGFHSANGIAIDDLETKPLWDGSSEGIDEVTSLGGFETLLKTCRIQALRRGFYRFGPTTWVGSDPLGLFRSTLEMERRQGFAVYPRLFSLQDIGVPAQALLGDIRRRESFMEDPSWFRGGREYRSGDPLKTIDWNATARTQAVKVKTFDPTVHAKFMILVNLHAFERISEGVITDYMEDVISTAASIAQWALDQGFEVGLHSNGALPDDFRPLRILPSAAEGQIFVILDYLARLGMVVNRRAEEMLDLDLAELPHGCTLVMCGSVVTTGLSVALADAARRRQVALVLVDNDTPVSIPKVAVVHSHTPREAAA
ncbi:MAG TPA: DUF58 domain-containing protein, partial [Chloroflexota bacterium]|nr:DUF58 domain-containing protein [Chloroflexota bacterium]